MEGTMAFRSFLLFLVLSPMVFMTGCERHASSAQNNESQGSARSDLWRVYERSLKEAKYIDLTHTLKPSIPVWKGFASAKFGATINPETGQPYIYEKDGFEATHYDLPTDQFGTQLDPPAHWAPEYPAIDELPATYAVRPLAVISIVDQVAKDPAYHLRRSDIERWEKRNGKIPAGSVVMVRSDWSKR
jgi:kynurenine formamidase